jgi:hypothetical protein
MILKANVGSGVWQYFESKKTIRKEVHFQLDPPVDVIIKRISIDNEVWNFTDRPCSKEEAENGVAEISLYDEGVMTYIFAYRPCYILNGEGKTIERI